MCTITLLEPRPYHALRQDVNFHSVSRLGEVLAFAFHEPASQIPRTGMRKAIFIATVWCFRPRITSKSRFTHFSIDGRSRWRVTFASTFVAANETECNMHKFIAYYRVSTKRQGQSGLGLDAQRQAVATHLASVQGQLVA